jgi:hypothetical protein
MKETLITCILERLEILYEKKKNISLIDCFYSKWINNYLFSINKEIEMLEYELKKLSN